MRASEPKERYDFGAAHKSSIPAQYRTIDCNGYKTLYVRRTIHTSRERAWERAHT